MPLVLVTAYGVHAVLTEPTWRTCISLELRENQLALPQPLPMRILHCAYLKGCIAGGVDVHEVSTNLRGHGA